MTRTKGQHGGKRVGAGRKPLADPIKTYSVKITGEQAELLKRWGGGDLSAGLRWLISASEILVKELRPRHTLKDLTLP